MQRTGKRKLIAIDIAGTEGDDFLARAGFIQSECDSLKPGAGAEETVPVCGDRFFPVLPRAQRIAVL